MLCVLFLSFFPLILSLLKFLLSFKKVIGKAIKLGKRTKKGDAALDDKLSPAHCEDYKEQQCDNFRPPKALVLFA